MTDRTDCKSLRERLDEAVAGARPELLEHVRDCAACAELVRRERSLVRVLSALPRAPLAEFPAPDVAAAPVLRMGRLARASWIAAAAAALLGAVVLHESGSRQAYVRVDAVVDVADAPLPPDDSLLALMAGVEAVAMQRPTEPR